MGVYLSLNHPTNNKGPSETPHTHSKPVHSTHPIHQYFQSPTAPSFDQEALPDCLPHHDRYYGDSPVLPKPDTYTRITTKNVNTLCADDVVDDTAALCGDQQATDSDIYGICEHNRDTHRYDFRHRFAAAAKHVLGPQHVLELGSSELRTLTAHKPGGTGLLAYGPITGRIYAQDSDQYGRWSYFHLRAADEKTITVIQVYQVCKKPTNQHGITAFHQQETAFRSEGRPDTSPRKNFCQDLIRFITHLHATDHNVIVMGDFNEHITDNRTTLQHLALDCQLVDIWTRLHPTEEEPATYLYGRTRLDYILISSPLVPAVQAIGYEPFHEYLPTDHRGIFIDFDTKALFGISHTPLVNAPLRSLQSTHPGCRAAYITAAAAHAHEHSLFTRLQSLLNSGRRNDALIEQLDALLGECCRLGEKRCTKIRTTWYTKSIAQLRSWRRILQKLISHFKTPGRLHLIPMLEAQRVSAAITEPLPADLASARLALTQARKAIKREIHACRERRLQEQVAQIIAERAMKNPAKAKILEHISRTEQKNAMWQMFRSIRGKHKKSALSTIEIPDSWPTPDDAACTSNTWPDPKQWAAEEKPFKTISLPAEIEYYLLARNRAHFGKAQGTPFTVPPLSTDLHWDADTDSAELILEGNYDARALDDITQLLLQFCRRTSPPDQVPATVTLEEYEGKIKTWREHTTTSPSGRHLGHYKTLAKPIAFQGQDAIESRQLEANRSALLQAHLGIVNYCLQHGYSLRRWQNIVNVMIRKDPDNVRIHRLRVIHLYEADYNLILSAKWRALQRHADQRHLLNDGQYGSRAGREANALPLFEELRTDIALSSWRPVINVDNDADSCFDRIVVAMSSLLSRKYGLHRHVVCVNASTLQQAQYTLKTSLGISKASYAHCDNFPIFGTGQGSGNSPVIWCFVSSTLFDCHATKAYGASFATPDRTVTLTFSMVGFVDDSTGTVNDFYASTTPTIEDLLAKMQHDAQLWHDLLWCSGGKLELPKCSYHFLYFDFSDSGQPVPREGQVGAPLHVTSPAGIPIPIPSKSVYTPHKTLGHHKAPAGTSQTQLKLLTTKMNRISQYLASSPATRSEAMTFYHAIYTTSIYVLPQSFFTPPELDNAESSSMPSIFAKAGYNRHTSKPLLYGPKPLLGAGFIRWKWIQGEGQIKHFIKYWRTPGQIGAALRIAVSWYQYHAGVSFSLLAEPHRVAPPPDCRWLPSLRSFLASINASLDIDQAYIPPIQRVGDRHLIDLAIVSGIFSLEELTYLNLCRLSLNVITVSDITEANGLYLVHGIRHGDPSALHQTPKGLSPHQPAPQHLYWTYWIRLLNLIATPDRLLKQPLGPWLVTGNQLRNTWSAYYDFRMKFLYIRTAQGYQQYELFDTRFITGVPTPWLPNDFCIPVTPQQLSRDIWQINHSIIPLHSPPPPPIPTTFQEFLTLLPSWEQPLFANLHLNYSPLDIAEKLSSLPFRTDSHSTDSQHPDFLLISDGSDNSDIMTFGWSLSLADGTRLAFCSGPAFGKGSSHRAEATGMLSGLRFLHHLITYSGLAIVAPFTVKSDNRGLIIRINQRLQYETSFPTATLASDWDLIEAIYDTICLFSSPPNIQHVKGHQDNHTAYSDLELDAQLNVDADAEANNYHLFHSPTIQPRVTKFPTTKVLLHIAGHTVTSHYTTAIRDAAATSDYLPALRKKHHWTTSIQQTIAQTPIRFATMNTHLPHSFLFKFAHLCLPTQEHKSQRDSGSSDCPHCKLLDDQQHFYRCLHPETVSWRANVLSVVRATCDDLLTSFELQCVIVDAIHALLYRKQFRWEPYPSHLHQAIRAQSQIGWHSFLRGFWAQEWILLQDAHLTRINASRNDYSGHTWASTLIKTLWHEVHSAWQIHNKLIHRTGAIHYDADLRARTILQVRHLHSKKAQVQAVHREAFFLPDLSYSLQHDTTAKLRNWIQLYGPAIHASIKAQSNSAIQNVKLLSNYFPITRPGPKRSPKPRYHIHAHTRHDPPYKKRRRRQPRGRPIPPLRTFTQTPISTHFST